MHHYSMLAGKVLPVTEQFDLTCQTPRNSLFISSKVHYTAAANNFLFRWGDVHILPSNVHISVMPIEQVDSL